MNSPSHTLEPLARLADRLADAGSARFKYGATKGLKPLMGDAITARRH